MACPSLLRAAAAAFAWPGPLHRLPVLAALLALGAPVAFPAGMARAQGDAAAGPLPRLPRSLAELVIPAAASRVAAVPTAAAIEPAPVVAPGAAGISLPSVRVILLELGRRTISLLEGGTLIGRWPVAIGDPATPTPTGTFQVLNKVVNPRYQSTRSGRVNPTIGPDGPLGDRWMGFHRQGPNQFGIHGTPRAWEWTVSSRAAVSHGCVRMLTPHVRILFDQVEVGTPVIVRR